MKNIKKISLLSLLSLATLFVGCNNDDNTTGKSKVVAASDVTGTVAFSFTGTQTVQEVNQNVFNVTVTIDKPQVISVHVKLAQIGGTATAGEDFTFPSEIEIPAYATSATASFKILNDLTVEGTENLILQVGGDTTANANFAPATANIIIQNSISDKLDLVFKYDKTFYGEGGYSNTLCNISSSLTPGSVYDVDYLLYNASNVDTGNYTAATIACDEHMIIDIDNYVDGLYHVNASLYTNADLDYAFLSFPLLGAPVFEIPISTEYLRGGAITKGIYAQSTGIWTSATAVGTETNLFDVLISTNGSGYRSFTIQDANGVIASGKTANKVNAKYLAHKRIK